MTSKITICWLRRDLRLEDQAALYHALKSPWPVLPLFIFDTTILDRLPRNDARVGFIHKVVTDLHARLGELGSTLRVEVGNPVEVWPRLIAELEIGEVHVSRDYEPSAIARDEEVARILRKRGVVMHRHKDHLIFDGGEVLKDDGTPYTVFTPYSKRWRKVLDTRDAVGDGEGSFYLQSYPVERHIHRLAFTAPARLPSLAEIGFQPSSIEIPGMMVKQGLIREYAEKRDTMGIRGTSRLGIHFRFGTISIREKARLARSISETYLNELIWRDFYSMVLQQFPHVVQGAFRKEYERVAWRNDAAEFEAWCQGRTGFPVVDAGMRELNATGFMHNRARMITASFLTKNLLIDWRWGEAYFAERLLDYDLASNNGGWQWAAGCGTDAAPYFRVFNPYSQQEKFDKDGAYVRRWIPELGTPAYPKPIVDLAQTRDRCLEAYKKALKG